MHPPHVKAAALELIAQGLPDTQVAARLDVARSTVRDWRRPTYVRRGPVLRCARCWLPSKPMLFSPGDYAELLGLYLGDGHVSDGPRTQRLRISLDSKYPQIVADAEALLRRCFFRSKVQRVRADSGPTVVVSLYHSHLRCLLPQVAAGKKHERPIELEPWQERMLADAPWPFLRGCIRSDGCVFVNRTGPYEYVSYDFVNRSRDILRLFAETCARVGVDCRTYENRVRINRRESVALMLENVGLKI